MAIRNNVSTSTGTLNTLVSGSVVGGSAIFLGNSAKKVQSLSARLLLTAATSTITISAKWQVSKDGSTWEDVTNGSQNAASVVLTTGTAAQVTKNVPAPDAIFGWQYTRIALVTGVVTGAAGDLYTIGYSYRQLTASDNAV
jgi:hypothetical protein